MTEVSQAGFLVPSYKMDYLKHPLLPDAVLARGLIHSFNLNAPNAIFYLNRGWELFKSYSIGVCAYGHSNDNVSRAIYVPAADKTKQGKERLNFIRNIKNKEGDYEKLLDSDLIPKRVKEALEFHKKNYNMIMSLLE
jgi:hypothetical protein